MPYTQYSSYSAATITVTNSTELNAAIASLSSSTGGTILVDENGGPYDIYVRDVVSDQNSAVLIRAADPNTPPTLQGVYMDNASYLTVADMNIDASAVLASRPNWWSDVTISNSNNIELVGNTMTGTADGFLDYSGTVTRGDEAIYLRNSSDILVSDNTIEGYYHGIYFLDVQNVDISGNDISGIQGDGIRGAGMANGSITNNYLYDFYGSIQTINHSDMIQLWGSNAAYPNSNIDISNNILDSGNGAATQGIFIRNEVLGNGTSGGGYFQDISVYDNIVYNGMAQGIGVSDTQGLQIYDNTVLWNDDAQWVRDANTAGMSSSPQIRVYNSPNANVDNNITGKFDLNGQDTTGTNYILSYNNPSSPNFVDNHFGSLSSSGPLDIANLDILQSSPLYGQYGASGSSSAAPAPGPSPAPAPSPPAPAPTPPVAQPVDPDPTPVPPVAPTTPAPHGPQYPYHPSDVPDTGPAPATPTVTPPAPTPPTAPPTTPPPAADPAHHDPSVIVSGSSGLGANLGKALSFVSGGLIGSSSSASSATGSVQVQSTTSTVQTADDWLSDLMLDPVVDDIGMAAVADDPDFDDLHMQSVI